MSIKIVYAHMLKRATLIGVHELHGRMQDHVTILFAVDPLSLFGYISHSKLLLAPPIL